MRFQVLTIPASVGYLANVLSEIVEIEKRTGQGIVLKLPPVSEKELTRRE